MFSRQNVATVAGATLGFIGGNVPGAFIGGKLAHDLTKNKQTSRMLTPVTARKRKLSIASLGGTPKKRRMSIGSSVLFTPKSRKSSISSRRSSVGGVRKEKIIAQVSTTARHKRLKKAYKGKKKKNVKVSRPLREKIKKVINGQKMYGTGRVLICGGNQPVNPGAANVQNVFPLPFPQSNDTQKGLLFDNKFIMYVASRLFNGRLGDSAALTSGAFTNVHVEKDSSAGWSNFTKDLATTKSSFKCDVVNLKAKITIKNNSTRTQYMKMYECKPKYQCKDTVGYGSGYGKPIGDWVKNLNMDFEAKQTGLEYVTGTKATGINAPFGATTQSVSVNTMYATPKISKNWNRQWSYNEYSIILEPGQTHVHWVQGDTGEYDFSKMGTTSQDGTYEFNNIQKTDRWIFFTSVPEMACVTTSGQTGRLLGTNNGDRFLFETEIFCSMTMPEATGTAIDVASAGGFNIIMPRTQAHRSYFVDVFNDSGSQTTQFTNNVDDNNPQRFTS